MKSLAYRLLVLCVCIAFFSTASWLSFSLSQLFNQSLEIEATRFTKVDKYGEYLSPNDGPWHCVYDSSTKLYWMVGRDDESPFDSYWSYSWYSEKLNIGVPDAGSCFYESAGCGTHHLISKANELALCNNKHWRLPTPSELLTLVQPSPKTGGATIHHAYFPQTKKGDYWTASHSQDVTTKALSYLKEGVVAVSFRTGEIKVLPYRTAAYVKLVSSQR
jgi:hypothetical protein